MRTFKRHAVILFLFILSGASPSGADGPDAVYNYKEWQCDVKGNGFVMTAKASITINNARGSEYSQVSFYENSFTNLKKVLQYYMKQ